MSSRAERGNPAAAFIQGEQEKAAQRPNGLSLRGGFTRERPIPSLESTVDVGPSPTAAPNRLIPAVFVSDTTVIQFPVLPSSRVPDTNTAPPSDDAQDGDTTHNKVRALGIHASRARLTAAAGALTFFLAACSSHGGIKIPEPLRSAAHQVEQDARQAGRDAQRDAGKLRQGAQRAAHNQGPEIEQQLRQTKDKAVKNGKKTIRRGRQFVNGTASPTPRPHHS